MGTRARVTTVAGAATLLCAASAFGGGLSALAAPSNVSATPVPAAAPAPMLVGGCGDTVRGAPGQRVGVREAGLSVIDVGSVPSSGSSTFDATPALHQVMGPVAPACKITAEPLSPVTTPVDAVIGSAVAPLKGPVGSLPILPQPSSPAAPSASPPAAPAARPQPASAPALASPAFGPFSGPMMPSDFPFALGRYSSGLPRYNYADLLAMGRPGALGRLSAGMLTADLFGTPQVSNGSGLGKQSAAANDVAAAGRATALPASGVERIALPVLVAVLMLASITAALLRGWVLGRR
ncbi:MAG TPA: hypothetical protein VK784_17520 [Pseudonocardiaceae bacterium]|jgi:hypothetical protein|nr:hypothetical protein [Pseudonocardiaceae bacterium]